MPSISRFLTSIWYWIKPVGSLYQRTFSGLRCRIVQLKPGRYKEFFFITYYLIFGALWQLVSTAKSA